LRCFALIKSVSSQKNTVFKLLATPLKTTSFQPCPAALAFETSLLSWWTNATHLLQIFNRCAESSTASL